MINAFLKDILRDLQKSAGRFAGMTIIIALGVFVFVGLGATGGIMYGIGDKYFRDNSLYDIQVVSTFGLNEHDLDAIRAVEGVSTVEGAYNLDAIMRGGTKELNAKLHGLKLGQSQYSQLNPPIILQGRYPVQENEILVEQSVLDKLGLSVGDEVELQSGGTADIRTKLKTNRFRITGIAQSPLYFGFQRGSSSVGNGEADAFALIPEGCFKQNIYSEAFVSVEGASGLDTYSDEYDALIQSVVDRVEAAGEIRIPLRKAESMRSAWKSLERAKEELEQNKALMEEQLLSSEIGLVDNERRVRQGRVTIAQEDAKLAESFVMIDTRETELRRSLSDIISGIDTLKTQEQTLILQSYTLTRARGELEAAEEQYLDGKMLVNEASANIDKGLAELSAMLGELDAQLAACRAEVAAKEALVQDFQDKYDNYSGGDISQQDAIAQQLEEARLALEGLKQQEAVLLDTRARLEAEASKLLAAKPELAVKFNELRRARYTINSKYTQLQSGQSQYLTGLEMLKGAISQLQGQKSQVEAGLSQIRLTRLQLESARQILASNRLDLSRSRSLLADGKSTLIEQREMLTAEIAEAEAAIRDSRKALVKIKEPKWYVLDRYQNLGFNMYDSEAASIKDLGLAFPFIFFLVGALVSLTTMTRLVEEQRVSMGTYKALGYSEGLIRAKYIFYAVAPSLLGALAGGLIGMILFPTFIIEIMYSTFFNIPGFEIAVNIPLMSTGIFLAVFSTTVPTLITCHGALKEVPASLMRPKAPPSGKKTPLEYITPLWRRLSFLYKITFRNIFRYKQRLFMTICGVGGSTAILLAALGLNDSMTPLVPLQYGELLKYDLSVSYLEDLSSSSAQGIKKYVDSNKITGSSIILRQEMGESHMGDGDTLDTLITVAPSGEIGGFIELRDRVSGIPVELQNDGVIISEPLSSEFGIGIGSEFILRDSDDEEFTVRVTGICEGYTSCAVYMTPEYYTAVSHNEYKSNGIFINQAYDPPASALDEFTQGILDRNGVTAVASIATMGEEFADLTGNMQGIIALIISISALMAFTVLINLTNINIVERMREIATIEVLGFRDKEVSDYVYRENMIVTFISSLFGIFVGRYMHLFMIEIMEGSGMMFPRVLTFPSYILAVAGTMLFALSVAVLTSGKLKKIDMLGALKSAE